jgi:hypothetical protein
MKDHLESEWVQQLNDSLGNLMKKPCQVNKAYLDLLDISMDYLDENMCCDCWPDEDAEKIDAETASA